MLSFSPKANFRDQLHDIDQSLAEDVEEEYVLLYLHVANRLHRAGIEPDIACEPGKAPKKLV
jgi:hypothetical protein